MLDQKWQITKYTDQILLHKNHLAGRCVLILTKQFDVWRMQAWLLKIQIKHTLYHILKDPLFNSIRPILHGIVRALSSIVSDLELIESKTVRETPY